MTTGRGLPETDDLAERLELDVLTRGKTPLFEPTIQVVVAPRERNASV